MKITVKSTYPQSDGWGRAAQDYLKAFMRTGHDISITPIVLSSMIMKEKMDWLPPVANSMPDGLFQQCLPTYFEKYPGVRNIGSCFTETRFFQQTGWVDKLNEMDEIIVATEQEKLNMLECGVTRPVHVVPMPMEFMEVDGELEGLAAAINNRYAFYFVGEFVDRKNVFGLLHTYWREFTREDDVVLVLKTSLGNLTPDQAHELMSRHINQFKEQYMRLYHYPHHYPEVIILTERLSDKEMVQLHNTCDCFITLSYGESTCRPLVDAAYYGKPIICTSDIGAVDDDLIINRVDSRLTPCLTGSPPIQSLYTGWECWMVPDLMHAQRLMRQAYTNGLRTTPKEKVKEKFSYESAAKRLNDIL